jgi:catalase
MVPVKIIGKMTLNRNPDNFFAETEQVAFLPGNIVPGIDFTNDPLLQGRLFSYRDTQLSRLGTPNFHQIPINKSVVPTYNNQRDGQMQTEIPKGQTAYFPNTLGSGCPHLSKIAEGAFSSYDERIDAKKVRTRSKSFIDFFSQPALFYRSLAPWEQNHVMEAYSFELGKCTHDHIKERMLWMVAQIDEDLAKKVAENLGLKVPKDIERPINQAIGADSNIEDFQPGPKLNYLDQSPALSQANTKFKSIATRQIAVLVADGFNCKDFNTMKSALEKEHAVVNIVAPKGGSVRCDSGMEFKVKTSIDTTESVLYDAVYIPGGQASIDALLKKAKFQKFINEALKHCKAIAADKEGEKLLDKTFAIDFKDDNALFINAGPVQFVKAIAMHRNWDRMERAKLIPA